MELEGYLTLLVSVSFLVGFVVLLQSVLPENVQKFLEELVELGQAFLSAQVYPCQRIEGFYLDQLLPELLRDYLNIRTIWLRFLIARKT